jgi:hypothetical protein
MVMDQNDTLPLSMPELLEKFAGHAEPLLDQLGLKKGIYTSYIYIYICRSAIFIHPCCSVQPCQFSWQNVGYPSHSVLRT